MGGMDKMSRNVNLGNIGQDMAMRVEAGSGRIGIRSGRNRVGCDWLIAIDDPTSLNEYAE